MPDRYPHFWGSRQICGESAPPVNGTNGKKLKMLNFKFACISDPAANTMQTAVFCINFQDVYSQQLLGSLQTSLSFCTIGDIFAH